VRAAVLALVALAATGCMGRTSDGTGAPTGTVPRIAGDTKLEISVSIGGSEAPTKTWTLECPNGGTLPHPERACAKLAVMDDPFAPTPKGKACTQVFGGPEVADVTGTFRGKPVNAHFTKGNGCEIARWDSVEFLFPTS
jgi:subtilisin inhibitor-like